MSDHKPNDSAAWFVALIAILAIGGAAYLTFAPPAPADYIRVCSHSAQRDAASYCEAWSYVRRPH